MSTRGFVGFVIDGIEKIAYNHHDSYPGGLGLDVRNWIGANLHALTCDLHRGESSGPVVLARSLRVVNDGMQPTDEDIDHLAPWTDTGVGRRSERPEWYQLLRKTQGDPAAILRAGYIEDGSDFPYDSLFAEWGYIVDLDSQTFEVYGGFQEESHDKGRFAGRTGSDMTPGYFPCGLVASWPLEKLPTEDEFIAALEEEH